jgi:hypothetical protein
MRLITPEEKNNKPAITYSKEEWYISGCTNSAAPARLSRRLAESGSL